MPTNKSVITGQIVSCEKAQRARELREAMTPAEQALWERLRANRLDNVYFCRQQIIDGFIADFYCHKAKLVIEVDGPIHERYREHDAERDAIMARWGLQILRVTNDEVEHDLDGVVNRIRGLLIT